MGEAKRKRERMTPVEQAATELQHKLADEGLLIRAGFVAYLTHIFPPDGPQPAPHQREQLMHAFLSGASHLFTAMIGFLDEGEEPTEKDMKRMDLIGKEMSDHEDAMRAVHAMMMKTKGRA